MLRQQRSLRMFKATFDAEEFFAACWFCFIIGISVGVGVSGVIWKWL